MTKTENLIAIREHLKTGIEGHRQKLAQLWEAGAQNTWQYKRLLEQYELMQEKQFKNMDELCPFPPQAAIKKATT